jgi:hypothetical protein
VDESCIERIGERHRPYDTHRHRLCVDGMSYKD